MQQGHTITAINNETVRNVEEALGALEKTKPNDEITFKLVKNGQPAVVKLKAETADVTTSTSIGRYAVSRWGGKSSSDNNMLSLNFIDKNTYASFRNKSTESISVIGNKNALAQDVLFSNEWLVVAAGLVSTNGNSLWKITDEADLGAALRLTGLSGVVDLVLFAKGTDVNNQNNYIVKRFKLSGRDNTFKQTLWY